MTKTEFDVLQLYVTQGKTAEEISAELGVELYIVACSIYRYNMQHLRAEYLEPGCTRCKMYQDFFDFVAVRLAKDPDAKSDPETTEILKKKRARKPATMQG